MTEQTSNSKKKPQQKSQNKGQQAKPAKPAKQGQQGQQGQLIVTTGLLSATLVASTKNIARTETQLLNAIQSVNPKISGAAKKAYNTLSKMVESIEKEISQVNKEYRQDTNPKPQPKSKPKSQPKKKAAQKTVGKKATKAAPAKAKSDNSKAIKANLDTKTESAA